MAEESRPLLRIVRGTPSDAELAALTAVVAAAASRAAAEEPAAPRSAWGDPAGRLRVPLHPGRGAWRASGFRR